MTDNDPGILGNLPRSRPGTRSDKRGANPGEPAAETAKPKATAAAAPKAAKPKAVRKPKAAAKPRPAAKARPAPKPAPAPREPQGADPVGDVLRAGEALARSGIRVGSAIAGEALRRLTGR